MENYCALPKCSLIVLLAAAAAGQTPGGVGLDQGASGRMASQLPVQAVRFRLPAGTQRVLRPTKVRMLSASQRPIGIITLYPDGTADWPVVASDKEGGGDGCAPERYKFELLQPDKFDFPIIVMPDDSTIGLSPQTIELIKNLAGNKGGVCGGAFAVVSGGRPIPANFNLVSGNNLVSGDSKPYPCPPGQRPPCEPPVAEAAFSATKSGIKSQELSLTPTANCTVPPCPWQTNQWPWRGQLSGTRIDGAQVGILDETGRVASSAPVQQDGSVTLPAPRGPIRGNPRVCLLARPGTQPICGEPGNPSPVFTAPGVRIEMKAITTKGANESIR